MVSIYDQNSPILVPTERGRKLELYRNHLLRLANLSPKLRAA